MSLDVPKKFHEVLKPFLEKELNIDVKLENDVAVITLTPVKTFTHGAKTQQRTAKEPFYRLDETRTRGVHLSLSHDSIPRFFSMWAIFPAEIFSLCFERTFSKFF